MKKAALLLAARTLAGCGDRAVFNGCACLPNGTPERVFRPAAAGTPVIIEA